MTPALALTFSLLLSLAFIGICATFFGLRPTAGNRDETIDGTRGFLALGVVAHHFMLHREMLVSGVWHEPSNTLFRNLGPVAVTVFFMITAFLFYGKLVRSGGRTSWGKLYFGRLARLYPMYLLAIALVFMSVFAITGFRSEVPILVNLKAAVDWIAFTFRAAPPVNGFEQTSLVISQVVWTLRYEWLFYFSLPLVALGIRVIPSPIARIVVLGFFGVSILLLPNLQVRDFHSYFVVPFLFGMVVYEVSRFEAWTDFCRKPIGSVISVGLLLVALLTPLSTYGALQISVIALLFLMIASGSDFFGVLRMSSSRLLGEATYGIYLLHGIALFWLFKMFEGSFEEWMWIFLPAASIAIAAIALAGFYLIERPVIDAAKGRSRIAIATDTVQ